MGEAPGQKDTFAFVDTNSMPAWGAAEGAPKTQVTGADSQVLTIMLNPGEEIQTEPGAMMHMSDGVQPDLGCAPNCCTRCCCLGESCWIAHYKNEGAPGYIGLTPNFPAKVISYDVSEGPMILKKHGYMAQLGGVELDKDVDCFSLTCCCGALGCCRQKISLPAGTSSGMAFINAGGTVLEKTLAEGEEVLIDHNSIVGFQETVKYDLVTVGNLLMCCAGGEGCFQAKMTGPGKVYMQSMSFEKFVNSLSGSKNEQAVKVCCAIIECIGKAKG
jgi:uncharacterized protein (AIM24 family)